MQAFERQLSFHQLCITDSEFSLNFLQFLNLVGSVQSDERDSVLVSAPQVPAMYDQY